jgi:hypothetical protein
MSRSSNVETIATEALRPYVSLLFLECVSGQEALAFAKLTDFMERARRTRPHATWTTIGHALNNVSTLLRPDTESPGVDQIEAFVHKIESSPSWVVPGRGYIDTRHELSIAMRRGRIFAVCCDSQLREALMRWLQHEPRPPFTRVSQNILQGAFLRGEAKGLWLHGTHMRSPIRPDTKHITGSRIQDALSPLEDSSFAMSAARAALPDDPARTALLGTVGTAPRKGVVWSRRSQDFNDFLAASLEAMELIEETTAQGTALDRPFPILAVESHDLSEVRGAYDILTLTPDDLPTSTNVTDEMVQAAEVLQRATLRVIPSAISADFKLQVGLDGATGGVLQAAVRMSGDDVVFSFGYDSDTASTNPESVRTILDALRNDDLFAVYYDSGHVAGPHGIGRRNINDAPFRNWQFVDFAGFDITREKPSNSPAEIHAGVGAHGDTSIFGWICQHYSSGWLICDDGPGEVADFVHISIDGTLSMIHAKAAHSTSASRSVAVSAYEVVAGQAAKNSRYLADLNLLRETLDIPYTPERAAWIDGVRVPDRKEFLVMLEGLLASDRRQVVIVQPHVSEAMVKAADASRATPSKPRTQELNRLRSLETLLHTTRGAIVALGAELQVIGSR